MLLLTAGLFVLIQQLEGNVLTPYIQGQAVRVHPILVFLAVIAGGELFGLLGVIMPAVAVLLPVASAIVFLSCLAGIHWHLHLPSFRVRER